MEGGGWPTSSYNKILNFPNVHMDFLRNSWRKKKEEKNSVSLKPEVFFAMCRPVGWLRRDVAGGRRRGSVRGWGGWRAEGGGGGGGGQAAATGQGTRK